MPAVFPARKLFTYITQKWPHLRENIGLTGLAAVVAFALALLWPIALVCGIWRPYEPAHLPRVINETDAPRVDPSIWQSSAWMRIKRMLRRKTSGSEDIPIGYKADTENQIATQPQQEAESGLTHTTDQQPTHPTSTSGSHIDVERICYAHRACQTSEDSPPAYPGTWEEEVDKAAIPDGRCPLPPYRP
ncbi:hypothetical protein CEP54_014105 [Fusarium duplospermum]|uniref:Uncharacterized protein n=1 Tax=Fusarium duplospermum TaxID=1325734 RepID=A0A428NYH8_9HYPO|nr:hypothetical protein CEP54_014105 [Fusarium duplospermum]